MKLLCLINSLVSAIDCTKKYEEEKTKQEQRYKEWNDEQEEIKKTNCRN